MTCSECGTSNPDEARFCLHCGARLERPSETSQDLEPYLPAGMLAKLEGARLGRAMEGERRIVTMLFCDVKGSTAMAETLDPEEWSEIMNGAFEHLIAPVYRYEGTLARLMGDAIFAFFGAPIAHEDDPERAVAAGLDIVDGIRGYRERVLAERGLDLNVRVGINTGPVVVGKVGSDLRLEYTAMGDAVNVAARMEQTADPGTVQVTAETHRLIEPLFEFESRGPIEVKGKSELVVAYRVTGRRPEPGALQGARSVRLVGRKREMATLRGAVEETLDGRGQVVSLISEAGLGKSRLIAETRTLWSERQPDVGSGDRRVSRIWETWQCASYDTGRPYAQYRRMLALIAGIRDTDPPEVVRRKLASATDPGASSWHEPRMRVWRSLFGVTEPDEQPLEGEAFRHAIMELVTGSTRLLASAPRLIVCEDLHWCDEASMDLLIETAKLVDECPFLFLFAYRQDRAAASWRLKQWLETEYPHRSTEIVLSPLSPEETGSLIDELLAGHGGNDAARGQIVERSDGNPLFVEELTTAVAERAAGAVIPTTLQGLITARLDALEDPTRHVLQLASVIGRSFAEPVLSEVAGDDAELRQRLGTLERVGLIAETARAPEREYAFYHSLTQEATYGTILLRARRDLHERVGEAFERLYENRLEEFAPVLAHHFREAGDDERTLRYAAAAGDTAARLWANAEAVAHYTTALDAAARLDRVDVRLEHLYPSRGRALELAGRHEDAVANYEEMRALAEEVDVRSSIIHAELAIATLYSTPTKAFDPKRGRAIVERTLELARELGDRAVESRALWNLMLLDVFGGGELHEALQAGEASLAIARELGAREQMAFTLNDLSRPYVAVGDLASARASLEEATPIWRELGNLPMLSENLASLGMHRWLAGDDRGALELSEEALRISEEIGNLWGQAFALMNTYAIHRDRGEIGQAMQTMEACISIAEAGNFVPPQATVRADLASLLANLGDLERAREILGVALAVAAQRQPIAWPWVRAVQAEVHLLAGELDEAETVIADVQADILPEPLRSMVSIQMPLVRVRILSARGDHARAIEIADEVVLRLRQLGVRRFVPNALLLKGSSLAAVGEIDEAGRVLQEATWEAEELNCRAVQWRALAELSRLVSARGDAPAATDLRAEAVRIVERIASSIDERDLRHRFLARPEVSSVLSAEP